MTSIARFTINMSIKASLVGLIVFVFSLAISSLMLMKVSALSSDGFGPLGLSVLLFIGCIALSVVSLGLYYLLAMLVGVGVNSEDRKLPHFRFALLTSVPIALLFLLVFILLALYVIPIIL